MTAKESRLKASEEGPPKVDEPPAGDNALQQERLFDDVENLASMVRLAHSNPPTKFAATGASLVIASILAMATLGNARNSHGEPNTSSPKQEAPLQGKGARPSTEPIAIQPATVTAIQPATVTAIQPATATGDTLGTTTLEATASGAARSQEDASKTRQRDERKAVAPAPEVANSPVDREVAQALYKSATASFLKGKAGASERDFKRALRADPSFVVPYRGLGLVYERRGQKKKASDAFRRYLRGSPNAKDATAIQTRLDRLSK